MKKKVLACVLSIIVVISAISTAVFADYGDWVSLTGSTQYWGYIRSGRMAVPNSNRKTASSQAEVYDSNNRAHYHYSRVQVWIGTSCEQDTGRVWATDRTTATTGSFIDNIQYPTSMRPYWGT